MKIKCLTFAALLSFSFLAQAQNGVNVSAKVFLQGALIGVPDGDELMRDDLREKQLLPTEEPYSAYHVLSGGGETVDGPAVFQTTGNDAIVDWVLLELRDPSEIDLVLHTRSALLQRDGDVVDVDGQSPVFFEGAETGEYYLALRHRNHLLVMTKEPVPLGAGVYSFDFSAPGAELYCDNSVVSFGGHEAIWAGDVNADGRSIWQGPGTDVFQIYLSVLSDPANENGAANFTSQLYLNADINMDGKTNYAGPNNDRAMLGFYVFGTAQVLGLTINGCTH